ncbi:MAG: hypothetical protein F6K19_23055 [Cyanothece sp. SIO1E1]|nr:hypothetical protein [Cyanothece sp. SIO1E1]
MRKYLGGYFLLKPKLIDFGKLKGKTVKTCSSCINDPLLDSWSLSWSNSSGYEFDQLKNEFNIDSEKLAKIRFWADQKFEEKKIGWVEVFQDLETVTEYSNSFFSHLPEKEILKLVFSEEESNSFIELFKPQKSTDGA